MTKNWTSVEIQRFSLEKDVALLPSLIDCYRRVYGGPEWDEWWACAVRRADEGHHWGLARETEVQTKMHRCCGQPIEIYWPPEVVEDDIRHDVNEKSSCWIAVANRRVVGACWGFPMTLEQMEYKFKLPVADKIRRINEGEETVAYQSEAILLPDYRHRGLYQEMVRRRHMDFVAAGLRATVVRTRRSNPAPSASFVYSEHRGYQIVGEYPATDGRVVQARTITGLAELL